MVSQLFFRGSLNFKHVLASSKSPFDSPNGDHVFSPEKVTYGSKRGCVELMVDGLELFFSREHQAFANTKHLVTGRTSWTFGKTSEC